MARKFVKGYSIEDIKVGMKIQEKDDKKTYCIITNIDDIHAVRGIVYNMNGIRVGFANYCFDKKCPYEYYGGKIDIINDNKEL